MLRNLSRSSQLKKTNMSIEQSAQSVQKKKVLPVTPSKDLNPKVGQVVHYTTSTRYHALVGGLFSEADDTLLYIVPNQLDNLAKRRHIVMKNIVYIISNWTHDKFPNVIYISLRGFLDGYKSVTIDQATGALSTKSSGKIAALELDSIQATMDQSSVRTYQLRYALRDSVTWDVSQFVGDFKFEVLIDDSVDPEILPLPSLMDFNVEVRKSP